MRHTSLTQVGKYPISVVNAEYPTIVTFTSGDLGKFERGDYLFWTAMLKEKHRWRGRVKDRITGRARAVLSPGDRFDRMKREMKTDPDPSARAAYKEMWEDLLEKGKNVAYIRPATQKELKSWCGSHKSDTRYVTRIFVNGKVGGAV